MKGGMRRIQIELVFSGSDRSKFLQMKLLLSQELDT